MSLSQEALDVFDTAAKMGAMLAGKTSPEQGCIIAELAGRWLAGHPRRLRGPLLEMHVAAIEALAEINAKQLFGGRGHPSDREQPS